MGSKTSSSARGNDKLDPESSTPIEAPKRKSRRIKRRNAMDGRPSTSSPVPFEPWNCPAQLRFINSNINFWLDKQHAREKQWKKDARAQIEETEVSIQFIFYDGQGNDLDPIWIKKKIGHSMFRPENEKELDSIFIDFLSQPNCDHELYGKYFENEFVGNQTQRDRLVERLIMDMYMFTRGVFHWFGSDLYAYAMWYISEGKNEPSFKTAYRRGVTNIVCEGLVRQSLVEYPWTINFELIEMGDDEEEDEVKEGKFDDV